MVHDSRSGRGFGSRKPFFNSNIMIMDRGNGISNAIFVTLIISGISGGLAVESVNSSFSLK